MVYASVKLKLVDYLPIQAHKPNTSLHITICADIVKFLQVTSTLIVILENLRMLKFSCCMLVLLLASNVSAVLRKKQQLAFALVHKKLQYRDKQQWLLH